jgi:hypothetical protein
VLIDKNRFSTTDARLARRKSRRLLHRKEKAFGYLFQRKIAAFSTAANAVQAR